jgi:hypothetical protein
MSKVRSRADFLWRERARSSRAMRLCEPRGCGQRDRRGSKTRPAACKKKEAGRAFPRVASLHRGLLASVLGDQPAPGSRARPGFAWSRLTPAKRSPNPLGASGNSRGRLHITPMGPVADSGPARSLRLPRPSWPKAGVMRSRHRGSVTSARTPDVDYIYWATRM